ncbi:BEM_HP_G0079980.mRNA.1.CDS.1 [Saccharomyces cerevisiae]|nr:BEM_HP_G0079980.mRNA.1.CDS.1 [Saccharomyces cerevisiae]CAI6991806.1 BEM_HP_G0079980.mRNA.1.CDS.1 [Saccharomyces cerevisiae]
MDVSKKITELSLNKCSDSSRRGAAFKGRDLLPKKSTLLLRDEDEPMPKLSVMETAVDTDLAFVY